MQEFLIGHFSSQILITLRTLEVLIMNQQSSEKVVFSFLEKRQIYPLEPRGVEKRYRLNFVEGSLSLNVFSLLTPGNVKYEISATTLEFDDKNLAQNCQTFFSKAYPKNSRFTSDWTLPSVKQFKQQSNSVTATITKPFFMVELCSHMILAVGITMPRWSWLSACRKNELFLCMFITNHASGHQKSPSSSFVVYFIARPLTNLSAAKQDWNLPTCLLLELKGIKTLAHLL